MTVDTTTVLAWQGLVAVLTKDERQCTASQNALLRKALDQVIVQLHLFIYIRVYICICVCIYIFTT